jgi:hypothetical protein
MRLSSLATQRVERLQQVVSDLARPPVVLLLVGLLLILAGFFLARAPLQSRLAFGMGGADPLMARNFYDGETTTAGVGFRWSDGDGLLRLPAQGFGAHLLTVTITAPRPVGATVPLTMTINAQTPLLIAQPTAPRRYHLLVPGAGLPLAEHRIRLQSDTFQPPDDATLRTLGVAVFAVDWRAQAPALWLVALQIALLALATLLFYAVLTTTRAEPLLQIVFMLLFVAIMLAMRHSDQRFIYRWNAVLMTAGLSVFLVLMLVVLRRYPPTTERLMPVVAWLRMHWLALASYVLITAAMLAPLVWQFSTHVIGYSGDNFEYLWKMQWVSDALLLNNQSPMFTPQIFYPAGAELTISETSPTHTLLSVPLTWLFGSTVSYNSAMLGSFVLTAFFTYLLAHRLGMPRPAAWVAGLIFAFCLRRFYHSLGHFGMIGSQWPVLALYAWEGLLTRRRAWDANLSGLALTLTTWVSWHYGTTFPLFLAVYTVVRLGIRQLPELLRMWRLLAVVATILIAMVLPLAQPYIEARARGETYQHLYSQVLLLSAQPADYLLPNPLHPLWGEWARQFYAPERGEQYIALAYSVMLLALAGLWFGRKQRVAQALAVVLAINVVASFGPELRLSETFSLELPGRFVYDHVPVLGNIRNWSRMGMYVALCAALLAGLALARVPHNYRRMVIPLAALLVLFESAAVLPLSPAGPRPVDVWLRDQPGTGAVLQVPNGFGGASQYYTLFTGKPTNQGVGKFPTALYREGRDVLFGFPRETALRLAQRWETDYIVVDEGAMQLQRPRWREQIAEQPLATEVYRAGGYSVYRVQR